MVGFYKHDIPAWMDGTEMLSDAAYRAYHVVVQLIMLNEGPITRNDRGIAGRCNQTLKTFQKAFDELMKAGKLTIVGGKISNARAGIELEFVMKNRENAGKGGKTRADREKARENNENVPANSLINNDSPQAPLENLSSLKEKRREEKKDTPKAPKGADTQFEAFKAAYPKRNTAFPSSAAKRRWDEAIRKGADPVEMISGAKGYAAEQARIGRAGTEFVKTADVWLNQGRWGDYLAKPSSAAGGASEATEQHPYAGWSDDRWREAVNSWRARLGHWPWKRSAPPDDPKTAVPQHILAELNIHPAHARAA